ncbi:conserved hypothetical protein [Hyphomicrobiales bacterium]|nr:conserved hypothetical protein [Hyphomicrobiales bacterium]CAH1675362.1 conserved hypothetical protein [Hyphomicrobiales bacterium]
MSELSEVHGLGLRAICGRTGIAMLGAGLLLVGAGLGMEGHAAASTAGTALFEGNSGAVVLIKTQQKKKKKVYRNRQAVPQQCRPWCPRDTNPCDPPDFKIADGRCDWRDEFW